MRKNRNSRLYTAVGLISCLIATAFFMFPLVILVTTSFNNNGFANYVRVFTKFNLFLNLRTSVIVVGSALIIITLVVSLAAFGFSKLKFKGNHSLYYTLLSGMMLPSAAIIYPLYTIVKMLGLVSSPASLIFPYATLSCCYNLMILKNYYDTIPDEMLEAATIDGASRFRIWWQIVMPVAKPGMAVVLMQSFLSSWNEVLMGRIFITDYDQQPLSVIPLRLAQSVSSRGFPREVMYAALVMCLLPVVIFYCFAARSLVSGLTAGAIKG